MNSIPWNDRCPRCRANKELKTKYEDNVNYVICYECDYKIIIGIGRI